MVGVVFEDFALGARKRRFHRLHLMQDVDAIPIFLDHARDAAHLTFNAVETLNN